ncbi:MAG TPA: cob(I)yrinic acid a,c-diamide adenosyltransferase [Steroidobacteraceae bacterium]|jgi:cob(I)alamin adenosyltransferase|nr:cob(I)yrinic acid a,c-diamide adenosyltransferase [Steroidobacteraceae bacterium]
MGNRLSRIVTRTGDDGTTSLGDGHRVPKQSARIEAMGDVDELNSLIGLLLSQLDESAADAAASPRAWLLEVQHDLFDLGAELSVPGLVRLDETRIAALEEVIETLNAALPPLKEFVLPGGSTAASVCHLARTVCRRAERRGWALAHTVAGDGPPAATSSSPNSINAVSLRYLNRLSDLLFVLARTLARAGGGREILWRNR